MERINNSKDNSSTSHATDMELMSSDKTEKRGTFKILDKRRGTTAQKKMQQMMSNSTRYRPHISIQRMADKYMQKKTLISNNNSSKVDPTELVQRKIEVGEDKYSFTEFHDLNGNPELTRKVDGEDKIFRLKKEQPGLSLEEESYTEADSGAWHHQSEETEGMIDQNFSRGRAMRLKYLAAMPVNNAFHDKVKSREDKVYARPFKSYTHGRDKENEIAAWLPGEENKGAGVKYNVARPFTDGLTLEDRESYMDQIISFDNKVRHVVFVAERFRFGRTALQDYEKKYNKALEAANSLDKNELEPDKVEAEQKIIQEFLHLGFMGAEAKSRYRLGIMDQIEDDEREKVGSVKIKGKKRKTKDETTKERRFDEPNPPVRGESPDREEGKEYFSYTLPREVPARPMPLHGVGDTLYNTENYHDSSFTDADRKKHLPIDYFEGLGDRPNYASTPMDVDRKESAAPTASPLPPPSDESLSTDEMEI